MEVLRGVSRRLLSLKSKHRLLPLSLPVRPPKSKASLLPLSTSKPRPIHLTPSRPQRDFEGFRPLPRLLYVQNPFVWLTNKLDFRFLRVSWDPSFNEQEFTRGARQAISVISKGASGGNFELLRNLMTRNALLNLRRDVELIWSDEIRNNVGLQPEDVQLVIPRKIHFRHVTGMGTKFCDIDLVFIGLKWLKKFDPNKPHSLVFVDIISRFHRNYSEGVSPEWTVSAFRVRRFSILPSKDT